jgi:hypothetical protein
VNQSQKIASLLAEGKFVVVSESETQLSRGPVTDPAIGYSIQIDSVHDTLEQARVVCPEDEEGFYTASKRPARKEATVTASDGAIPF